MAEPALQSNEPINEALATYFMSVDHREALSISRLIAQFPQCEAELRKFFQTERRLNGECRNLTAVLGQPLVVPATIGRFTIEKPLGSGAFGVVYLAVDESLKREVALKVPLPQILGDAESRRRFEAEAAAAALLDHEGIMSVYEADFTGEVPYIASAYCPGPDLRRWLTDHHTALVWREAALLMAKLADAVHYAHQQGVYHRDLKPSNVLLMPGREAVVASDKLTDYSPKLTDFGLAKCALLNDTQTHSSMLIGTPLYMAPEQLESARLEHPGLADIYSLGCMLYELVAGTVPIVGENYAAVLDRLREAVPTPVRQLAPQATPDLERICQKCLEKNPLARYATAKDLAEDLRACADGKPIYATNASWWVRLRYWITRPQRILEAGWYTLCVQSLLTIWIGIALVASGVMLDIPASEMAQMFAEFSLLTLVVNLPMAAIGWFTTKYKPWAVRAGLFLSAVNLAAPTIFLMLSQKMFFNGIYARVDSSNYFAFAVCALVALAEVGQLLLYIAAHAALSRRDSHCG